MRMNEAFSKGDIDVAKDWWSEDIIWQFPGGSKLAGVYQGKEAVMKHLGEPRRLGAISKISPLAFFGDADYGGFMYEITSTRDGKSLTETRVVIYTIANEKIIKTRIYLSGVPVRPR